MLRHWTTTVIAVRMMLYDKPKLIGTTLGVVFAVVLATQQFGVLFGQLQKNTMMVDDAGADIWVCSSGTIELQGGQRLSEQVLVQARNVPGVAIASPLVYGTGGVQRPTGGTGAITIVGTEYPAQLGITFGTSTAFGLIIGSIIVALSMFSAVIDNIKEFGTLKAMDVTNGDLSRLLITQSVLDSWLGSFIGLGAVGSAAEGIRSAGEQGARTAPAACAPHRAVVSRRLRDETADEDVERR